MVEGLLGVGLEGVVAVEGAGEGVVRLDGIVFGGSVGWWRRVRWFVVCIALVEGEERSLMAGVVVVCQVQKKGWFRLLKSPAGTFPDQ